MPIEICYRFLNQEEGGEFPVGEEPEFGHEHVEPSDAKIIYDYSTRQADPCEVTIVACNQTDDGAQLYYLEPAEPFISEYVDGLTEDDLPEDVESVEIDQETIHEQELTLEDGTDVIFIARYTPPNEISEGLLIPRLLIFPS